MRREGGRGALRAGRGRGRGGGRRRREERRGIGDISEVDISPGSRWVGTVWYIQDSTYLPYINTVQYIPDRTVRPSDRRALKLLINLEKMPLQACLTIILRQFTYSRGSTQEKVIPLLSTLPVHFLYSHPLHCQFRSLSCWTRDALPLRSNSLPRQTSLFFFAQGINRLTHHVDVGRTLQSHHVSLLIMRPILCETTRRQKGDRNWSC